MIQTGFIEKFFEDSFLTFSPEVSSLTFSDAIIVLFWSISLSMIVSITYRGTHKGISYSQSFTQTLVLLGVVVSIVMLIVGTDIARAFTLVGALSIVRFRNAIKDTRDVGFIFFIMAVGMACGTRFYALALFFTLIGCLMLFFMYSSQFGQKGLAQDILELNIPIKYDYSQVLSPIFTKNLKYYSILSVDSIDEEKNRISFIITFKKKLKLLSFKNEKEVADDFTSKSKFLGELKKIEYISNVKVINGSHSTEV
ncbi:DUF4956 domain-containing protein [Promethearchaeum syntrophicum]|uniref:DUF4956 domain-containing protein n=1 Tax=Promethearchaeum syntrophicum TaxID=2594042 RepID=A0A5B9DGS9_9ARCH|nr:DUF4956 domain-containing protein [Candidatus Prometheoarchaeum syntrophicum]QEE17950.1 hypothetical protein DSAG12_03788 [Candidatus Prometheoarchaeum syntrophicum]